jgi:hypothetical protein
MDLIPVADLSFDESLYPRHALDPQHVRRLAEAFQADQNLPPLVVCKATRKIVDGVHRWKALLRLYDAEARWYVKEERFADDRQRFLRTVELNGRHGMPFGLYDRPHCLVIAERLRISVSDLAAGFGVTKDSFEGACKERFAGAVGVNELREPRPLKRTIRFKSGQVLTPRQWEANDKLSGWPARFHVDQVIELIEADLLDPEDVDLWERLRVLHERLGVVLRRPPDDL